MTCIIVAHDVICPWCWVGRIQAKRLQKEFPSLQILWKGYELLPEGLPYPSHPANPDAEKKPRTPTRFQLMLAAEGLVLPKRERDVCNSRLALEGAEYARTEGRQEAYLDALYQAYWEEDRDIADRAVLLDIAESAGLSVSRFNHALEERQFRESVVEFDDPAHAAGVWNVPTWMFTEEWVAEQPYSVLRDMMEKYVNESDNVPCD